MIGKLIDDNGEEVILESSWGLKKVILTMDELAEIKLNLNGKYVEEYVYKIYVHNGAEVTRTVGGEKKVNDVKTVMGYYDSIYDAINYIEKIVKVTGDVEYVEYMFDKDRASIVYTIKTEKDFVFDIVEQQKWTLI